VLIDTHCHLDEFDDPGRIVDEAAAAGVSQLVTVAQDPDSMRAALDLKQRHPEAVLAGLGIHPALIVQRSREEVEAGLRYLADELIHADELAEVGLDYKWAETPAQRRFQDEVLQRQLEIAAACRKPISLHSRRSQRPVMERAVEFCRTTGLQAQLHWFTQSRKLIRICNEEGIFVSVGPTVIDDPQTGEVALTIADHLLLLETDAPISISGIPGHPKRTRDVAEKLAELKGVSLAGLAEQTSDNFRRYSAPA